MEDQEFKKKLDHILETLYQIDREAKEAVERERSQQTNQEHKKESPHKKDNQKTPKNRTTQNIDNRKQQSL